ncbi:phosphoadenosine phosphosulfate reductase [Methanofollis formosanus]|uniref:Phosphoadenosine phosphosulfate reductase n=1 Tax=Methanofollis formosanus TaxID=299308 RepID=A0A8G0ZY21_9EURY|nr:phosphoadenosine phosphosulfate reductase family protein [Methanofollis formosanus]QYZ77945.1 phosphoadenosine phosphosulfate reductase [Methanofollis formosanus]
MQEPAVKKTLYWCPVCNLPLIGKKCRCGAEGVAVALQKPYDVRPALSHDMELLRSLLRDRFGTDRLPQVVLFNKIGGVDRAESVIADGVVFGRLTFDPASRTYTFDLSFEALSYLLPSITRNVVDITDAAASEGRIGGKRVAVRTDLPDGPVVVRMGNLAGVGTLREGAVKVKQIGRVDPVEVPDPSWEETGKANAKHLKNLERTAIRFIRQHMHDRPRANVSFSGGKDSTVVLELARRAGIDEVYYVNTGVEFPETVAFVKECGIEKVLHGPDFWSELKKYGLPRKDDRWCCERLKLQPVKEWLEREGPCVTVQGNRWYESFSRSTLPPVVENPFNPRQLNISPVRNWRALEVFLYLWWRQVPYNPLYEEGFERVGCWLCPAMLESEAARTRELHPELVSRWEKHLNAWAKKERIPQRCVELGLWRWQEPPPKMRELAAQCGIRLPKKREKR